MITDKIVDWNNRHKSNKELTESGFVSTNTIVRPKFVSQYGKHDPKILRKKAETSELLAVKVNTAGAITYWYKLSDICKMMPF